MSRSASGTYLDHVTIKAPYSLFPIPYSLLLDRG